MRIAPMLLFTFVENCFKHGSCNDPNNPFINIDLKVIKNEITFFAENSKPLKEKPISKYNEDGIGLNNVRKRLEIIYKDNYSLEIQDLKHSFVVSLSIKK